MTTERPILFSGPMVRAIEENRKTETRRVVKPQPHVYEGESGLQFEMPNWHGSLGAKRFAAGVCRYKVGERIWVRETFAPSIEAGNRQIMYAADGRWGSPSASGEIYFHGWTSGVTDKVLADWQERKGHWVGRGYFDKFKPSIFMPRKLSRITLEITAVRVERLQEITEAAAVNEGFGPGFVPTFGGEHASVCVGHRPLFVRLWDQLNGKTYPWASNPWVWVVGFKRCNRETS